MPSSPTWPEVPHNACVVVPVGSFEQHGPHLPLDTDTQIASHLCAQATTGVDNVVVAPPLSITASGEHAGFPGTISIGTEAFAAVIVELVRSCDWATGVILVHGHGGNLAAVQRATAILNSEQRNIASWWPHIPGADAHAGHTETSLMLAINPSLVRIDKLDVGNVQPASRSRSVTPVMAPLATAGFCRKRNWPSVWATIRTSSVFTPTMVAIPPNQAPWAGRPSRGASTRTWPSWSWTWPCAPSTARS